MKGWTMESLNRNKYECVIGIDPGTHTGFAIWFPKSKTLSEVSTYQIHRAFELVLDCKKLYGEKLLVRFEDARKRNWFADAGREQLQGAGSIKRD
ncbi:hypothetical protein, partial [Arachidicoccus sp.]|uniref:hypothetical protein n=1 Tax=Arachidicoccus sp. TaxID=1872624 RepID=UPI003D1F4338